MSASADAWLIAVAIIAGAWLIGTTIEKGAKLIAARIDNHARLQDEIRQGLSNIAVQIAARR